MENLYNVKIVTNGDMSTDVESTVTDMSKTNGYSVYAKWTGSPVGTIKLKASLDDINFVDITGSETAVNSTGEVLWEVTSAFYDKLKVVYTSTSGTGTLNVQINGKGDIE